MRKYSHLFFDLDHTLWDFRANSRETLRELYAEEDLNSLGVSDQDAFIASFEEVNEGLWSRYEAGRLHRDVLRILRFRNTLMHFAIRDQRLADRLARKYLERCPYKPVLMPGARRLLQDLDEHYRMHIITNGFDAVQAIKVRSSGIVHLFASVISSEKAGVKKPDPKIFDHALKISGARKEECLMIGDNPYADMIGARRAGWDHAHFAAECEPDAQATYTVKELDELRPILLP